MYDTLKLIRETKVKNDIGQLVPTEIASKDILCEVVSITRTEWDSAQQRGYEAEICLKVFFADYSGQRICEWQGERFEIYRTFRPGDRVELYLGRRVGV